MSLATEKEAAKSAIAAMLQDMMTKEESSTEEFADRLINIMETWIGKATIVYTTGLVAGPNVVTGTFTGKLE